MELIPSIIQSLFLGTLFLAITLIYSYIRERKMHKEEIELRKKIDIWEYHRKIVNSHELSSLAITKTDFKERNFHKTTANSEPQPKIKNKRIKFPNNIMENIN